MTPQDNTQKNEPTPDTPPAPKQAPPPPISLEHAERQHSLPGIPRWQPEEGDFN